MVYKALVFDFFGVVCSEIAPPWIKSHLPGKDTVKIHDLYISSVDVGKTVEKDMFKTLATLTNTIPAQVEREWHDLISIDQDVVNFIRGTKKIYKIGLCSNAWSSFIRPILEEHHLFELFDALVISSEIHHSKPGAEAYLAILDKLRVEPHEALMIDDSPINVEGAKKVGMSGIVFKSLQQLKLDLGAQE